MTALLSRREMLTASGVLLGSAAAGASTSPAGATEAADSRPFQYSLNTATIMGHKLPLAEEVDISAEAGYDGIEPWIGNIRRYVDEGGSLADMKKRIADSGLQMVSAIGFPRWAVDDDAERAKGLEQFKHEMDLVVQLGGRHIAAPPAGISHKTDVSLLDVAARYRVVLEMGREIGITAQLEIWGSATTLGRVGEAALVAMAADHPDACLLLDAFHMYRGNSGFECLRLLNGAAMHAFHLNDYPADPPREKINDAARVYPGDGVCPLDFVLKTLHETGFRGMLSLEVFNRTYWEQDALSVAKTGLGKMKAAVQKALG
jgi:2-keto-myo-inositol isomerase